MSAPLPDGFATLLEAVADVSDDAPAVVQGGCVRSWRQFDERAARLASWLAERGVGRGDRVAVALYNSPAYLESVFAILKLRALPVNVNYRYRERELQHVLGDSGAVGLIHHEAIATAVDVALAALPRPILRLRVADDAATAGLDDFETAIASSPPAAPLPRAADDRWLLYTGGTTGAPKAVVASHAWLYRVAMGSSYSLLDDDAPTTHAELRRTVRTLQEQGRTLTCVVASPLMHGVGIYSALGTFLTGGTVVLPASRGFDADETLVAARDNAATDLAIVGDAFARPLVAALDAAAARREPIRLPALRRIRSVGATWSAETKSALLRHLDVELRDTIAASEGGPFAVAVASRETGPGATSRFVLAPQARVLAPDGADVQPGSGVVGHLAAPATGEVGYFGDDTATAATYRVVDGQRYTVPGDLATLEADGSLVLLGRSSRVINTGGEKVFAEEVEQVLLEHPDVADALVVGIPDERFGSGVAALVVTRDGGGPGEEELTRYVGERLAGYKRPRLVASVPHIRRSPTGKADLLWGRAAATEIARQRGRVNHGSQAAGGAT